MAYSKPELRKRIVASVKAGTAGGKAGQWSARKAQIANKRYQSAGGSFSGPKTAAQSSLSKWSGPEGGVLSQVNLLLLDLRLLVNAICHLKPSKV
jgi:hypothetical protein